MSLNTTLQLGYIRIVLCYYYHDYLLSVLLDLPEAISTKYECNIYYCFTLRKEGRKHAGLQIYTVNKAAFASHHSGVMVFSL